MTEKDQIEVKLSSNMSKTRYPEPDIIGYERITKCDMDGAGNIYAVTGAEKERKGYLALFKADIRDKSDIILEPEILKGPTDVCGQPDLCVGEDGLVHFVWTQYENDNFKIMYMQYGSDPQVIYTGRDICYYPCLCELNGRIYVAFSSYEGAGFIISLFSIEKGKVYAPVKFSSLGGNCFRPAIAGDGRRIILAWDCLGETESKVSYVVMDHAGKVLSGGSTESQKGQRCINPAVCGAKDGGFLLSWVITSEVMDEDLGIIDHRNAAGLAKVDHRGIFYYYDDELSDYKAAADLREGLLGEHKYCGYYGNRRRPVPTYIDGCPALVYEAMLEPESENRTDLKDLNIKSSASFGCLLGKIIIDEKLSPVYILSNKGTGYCVPKKVFSQNLPAICFDQFTNNNDPVFKLTFASQNRDVIECRKERWDRWKPFAIDKDVINHETVNGLKVLWADTHVHSSFSPDAEGEPEEIIHFAKYILKLDIVAMVDNDFYPFYSLSSLKWKIHNALAKIFTVPGEFTVIPGYEYTYHDADVFNGFNHRYVLYERYDGETFRRIDRGSVDIRSMMTRLRSQKALAFCHHTTWEMTGLDNDTNAEIFSSWRVCAKESDFIEEKIKNKEKISFVGSSDTHRMVPGLGGALTAVYAQENKPEEIFKAYYRGNTSATQGQRIFIEFFVNDVFIGGEGEAHGKLKFNIKVISPDDLEYIDIKQDAETLNRYDVFDDRRSFVCEYLEFDVPEGSYLYYLEIKTRGDGSFNLPEGIKDDRRVFFNEGRYPHNFARAEGPYAITSPVLITVK